MPENLNWNFNLMNGVGGPAAEMAAALEALTKRLMTAAAGFDALEKAMKKTGEGSRGAISGLAEFGLKLNAIKELAAPLMEAGRFALEKGWDFEAKSIEALEFKENTLASFEVVLGSAKKAEEFFSKAAWLGRSSPFKTQDVVKQFQSLLSAGFTQEEVPVVFQAIGDAASMKGLSADVMSNITNALTHAMSSGGHNMGRVMQMLQADASGTGFQRGKFTAMLAKNLGVTPDDLEGMMADGQVDGRAFTKAFIDHMAETAGGGVTGGGMKRMENNFRGILNTLEGTFSEFFFLKPGSADNVPGFQILKGAMMNLRDAMNITTPAGKALQDAVVGAFGSITKSLFGTLSGPDGMRAMIETVEKTAVVVGNLGSVGGAVLDGLWAAGKGFATALGLIDDNAGSLFDGPMTPENVDKLRRSMVDFGKEAGEAMAILAESLKSVFGAMLSGVKIAGALVEINTAPTAYDKQLAWSHLMTGLGVKSDKVEGKDYFLPGKDYNGTTYDAQGRASMSKTPAMGVSSYLPPISVVIHSSHAEPAAVGAMAQNGVSTALQQFVQASHRIASQAGEH